MEETNPWVLLKRNSITADRKIDTSIFAILSAASLLKRNFSSVLSLSGRQNNRGVWRREGVCCSACSTYPRPLMAMYRARPRGRGLVAGCVSGSNAVPIWLPWMSTVIQTPTLKRKVLTFIYQTWNINLEHYPDGKMFLYKGIWFGFFFKFC